MSRLRDDYAVLLSGADGIELVLARSLLEAEGIPCFRDAAFELAEGSIHPPPVGVGQLYVPRDAHERAASILSAAWGPGWDAKE